MFHTYGANPTAVLPDAPCLRSSVKTKCSRTREVGAALYQRLLDLKQRHDVIGDVRGRSLMLAIEMVKDRKTKELTVTSPPFLKIAATAGLFCQNRARPSPPCGWCRLCVCRLKMLMWWPRGSIRPLPH